MSILLVNPPINNFHEQPCPPLGLAYIASVLEENDIDVKIYDMPILNKTVEDFTQHLDKKHFERIGVTCVAHNYKQALDLARISKENGRFTILGGPFTTFMDKEILKKYSFIDVIVRGEGEYTAVDLTKTNNLRDILGISYRQNKEIIRNADQPYIQELDKLPFPARHLLPMEEYKERTKWAPILTSRGCLYSCIFCSSTAMWGEVRARSPQNIIAEVRDIREKYGYKHFKFIDDLLNLNNNRTDELCSLLKEEGVKWACNTRMDHISTKLLSVMRDSGCEKIIYGIESLSPQIQKRIGKRINLEKAKSIIKLAKDLGTFVKLNFMIGWGEKEEDIQKSIEFANNYADVSMFAKLTPYPGTKVAKHMEAVNWETFTPTHVNLPELKTATHLGY